MPLIRLLTGAVGLAFLAVAAAYALLALAAIRKWRRRMLQQGAIQFPAETPLKPSRDAAPSAHESPHPFSQQNHPQWATCNCCGVPTKGVWSRVGAMCVNEWFIPSLLVGSLIDRHSYVYDQTVCARRETLLPEHKDATLGSIVRHELRWMRTLQLLRPWYFRFLFCTFSIPLAVLGIALTVAEPSFAPAARALFQLTVGARLALHFTHRLHGSRPLFADLWLIPIRDFLRFWVWCRSFFPRRSG